MAEQLTIVYNNFAVGVGTPRPLHDFYSMTESYRSADLQFAFLITAANEAEFATLCSEAEAAFRAPWQSTQVFLGSNVLHEWREDNNTGLRAEAQVGRSPGEFESGVSRLYHVTISIERPANVGGQDGRQDSEVLVHLDMDRIADISITGTYTAMPGSTANEVYQDRIDNYCLSILDAYGGLGRFELTEETQQYHETDKLVHFSRSYSELLNGMAVDYGGFQVGQGTARRIVDGVSVTTEFTRLMVEFSFRIEALNEADFTSRAAEAEEAFRVPRQDLVVTVAGQTYVDTKQSENTGFDATPSIRRAGDATNLGVRSRTFTVQIELGLPANVANLDGRRAATVDIQFDEDRVRSVVFTGQFTAIDGNSATQQYEANVQPFIDGILAGLQSEFSLVSEGFQFFETDKVADFQKTYRETTDGVRLDYGSYSVGQGTGRRITGEASVQQEFDRGSMRVRFVLPATDAASFALAAAEAERAFRAPRQDVVLTLNGAPYVEWKQSENTGFDSMASISRTGDPTFAGFRSRIYEVEIAVGLPADVAGLDGRREATVAFSFSESRRMTVTVTGQYTAIETHSAQTVYEEDVAAFIAGVLPAAPFRWELVNEHYEFFETNKVLQFHSEWQQVIHDRPGDAVGAAIVQPEYLLNQSLAISLQEEGLAGDDPRAADPTTTGTGGSVQLTEILRLGSVAVDYQASLNSEHVNATQFNALYAAQLRPYLIAEVQSRINARAVGLVTEQVSFDPVDMRVHAKLECRVLFTSGFIQYTRTDTYEHDPGVVLRGLWTGNPLSKRVYQGIATITCTIEEQGVWAGAPGGSIFGTVPQPAPVPGVDEWVAGPRQRAMNPRTTGTPDLSFVVHDYRSTITYSGYARED